MGVITNFPSGVSSFGAPVFGGGQWPSTVFGNTWFVDGRAGTLGSTGGDGSRETPFATMAAAFSRLGSGDIIYFKGNVREQIETPLGVFDVTIVGCGNLPRHSDAHAGHDTNGGYSSATWRTLATPLTTTPLLVVNNQGWRFVNILFDGPSAAAAVQILRTAATGDAEIDGSHAWFQNCKFVAAQNHLEVKGGLSHLLIENCLFQASTGASFLYTLGAGQGTNNYFRILNNIFMNNASHIVWPTNMATIKGNVFGKFTTKSVDLTAGGDNMITGNTFSGDWDAGAVAASGDTWVGNFSGDTTSAEVGDETGLTITPVP